MSIYHGRDICNANIVGFLYLLKICVLGLVNDRMPKVISIKSFYIHVLLFVAYHAVLFFLILTFNPGLIS